jgi:hypothetical protein
LEPQQFEDISDEVQALHKSMKNIIEIVFATSPLLALSTHGWTWKSHSTYLLRIFLSLGNDRPQILIELEDCVLKVIMAISEGKPFENAMDALYSQISSLEKDLANNDEALNWFNLENPALLFPATPPASVHPSTPSAGMLIYFNSIFCLTFSSKSPTE